MLTAGIAGILGTLLAWGLDLLKKVAEFPAAIEVNLDLNVSALRWRLTPHRPRPRLVRACTLRGAIRSIR